MGTADQFSKLLENVVKIKFWWERCLIYTGIVYCFVTYCIKDHLEKSIPILIVWMALTFVFVSILTISILLGMSFNKGLQDHYKEGHDNQEPPEVPKLKKVKQ